jgi:hypothetical protein
MGETQMKWKGVMLVVIFCLYLCIESLCCDNNPNINPNPTP